MSPPHQPPADATARFANRVGDYVKTRPGYPPAVIALLRERCGLRSTSIVADIGAGTGIFTRLLLDAGAGVVYAIEPNAPMHDALIEALGRDVRLRTHAGTAEHTGLSRASVDLIVAAQAFHWFDREKTRTEFVRILRPHGRVALVWNTRREDTNPFLVAYEQLLRRWSTDYGHVNHRNVSLDTIAPFFAPGGMERHAFPSHQEFDFDGVRGRLLSSSYAPAEGHPNHEPMLAELRQIFDATHENGRVRFEYETEVYLGRFVPL
jgi:SAM-dependent methyltransferase